VECLYVAGVRKFWIKLGKFDDFLFVRFVCFDVSWWGVWNGVGFLVVKIFYFLKSFRG
jgi:hypothetical protein